jgi:conjugative transfer signal peptidase TraF
MRFIQAPCRPLFRHPWLAPLGLFLLTCLYPAGLRLNLDSESQPRGVYWLQRGEPRSGQMVLVRLPVKTARLGVARGYLPHRELAKCVAALPGDTVGVSAAGLTINGRLLPATAPLSRDSQGRPLSRYPRGPHDTLPGFLWLYSNHIPNSWDSRYFGPVPAEAVLGRLIPLLTWPPFPRNPQGDSTCNWQTIDS